MSTISFEDASSLKVTDPVAEPEIQNANTWTEVKTKRAWAIALTSLCLIGAVVTGALTFTASLWFLAPAIPLLLAAGGLIWYACKLIDYDNPKELEKVRNQASQMSLSKIIEKFGWEKLFRYALLNPAQFEAAYSSHVAPMKLMDLLSFYETSCQRLANTAQKAPFGSMKEFHVPEPRLWKSKLSEETQGLNFKPLVGNYPLQNLIAYSLIEPQELEQSFIACASDLRLHQLIDGYEKTTALIKASGKAGYSLPAPERWKEKFVQETAHLSCSKILTSYKPWHEALLQHKIIGQEEYEILARGQESLNVYSKEEEDLRAEFRRRTQNEEEVRSRAKSLADKGYAANPAHILLANLHSQFVRDKDSLDKLATVQIDAERSHVESYRQSLNRSSPITDEERRYLANLESRCETNIWRIKRQLEFQMNDLDARYWQNKAALEQNIRAALALRDEAYTLSDQQFALSTKPAREDVDAKMAQSRLRLEERLGKVDAEYDQFRSVNRAQPFPSPQEIAV